MAKYLFEYPYNKTKTEELILENTEKATPFSFDNKIYAKCSQKNNRIQLYHGTKYRNSFMPILEVFLSEKSERCTVVKGFVRWHWPTMLLTAVILMLAIIQLVDGIIKQDLIQILLMGAFGLCYTLVCWFGVLLEKNHMRKIIEHLEKLQTQGANI